MKIVITTQIRENYSDTDVPYWKCKGGDVYVIANAVEGFDYSGSPIRDVIESCNSHFEEFVIGFTNMDDDAVVCDPWESPWMITVDGDNIIASRTTVNDEYNFMNQLVASKEEQYRMLTGGDRADYRVIYVMRNGDRVNYADVNNYIQAQQAIAV